MTGVHMVVDFVNVETLVTKPTTAVCLEVLAQFLLLMSFSLVAHELLVVVNSDFTIMTLFTFLVCGSVHYI